MSACHLPFVDHSAGYLANLSRVIEWSADPKTQAFVSSVSQQAAKIFERYPNFVVCDVTPRVVLRNPENNGLYVLFTGTDDWVLGQGSVKVVRTAISREGQLRAVATVDLVMADPDPDWLLVERDEGKKRCYDSETSLLREFKGVKGVVQIEASVETEDRGYMIEEYCPDGDLHSQIFTRAFEKRPLSERMEIFKTLVEGVRNVHAKGVVHADLKPENVLLSGANAEIGDFGLSFRNDDQTALRNPVGPFLYVSPERWLEGQQIGEATFASDMWMIGLILLLAISVDNLPWDIPTNRRLAFAKMKEHDLAALAKEEVDRLRAESDYPSKLFDLIESLLSKDPEQRPNAEEAYQRISAC